MLTGATTGSGSGSASGLTFNQGVTTVTYTRSDDATQSCSFMVTVEDREKPVVACPGSVLSLCFNSEDVYTIPPMKTTDNCGLRSFFYELEKGLYFITLFHKASNRVISDKLIKH
jgi:hypothetical protein